MNRRLYAFLITAILLLALDSAVHRAPVSSASPPLNDGAIVVQVQTGINCANVSEIPTSECNALVALYNSTNGSSWINNTGWLSTNTPCSWYGVMCGNNHVTRLELYSNQLSGSIPPELGNLANLETLDLVANQLSGSIPPQLGNLTNLRSLYLDGNQLSGSIPPQLGNLAHLTGLELGGNQLSGNIPPELGNLANLGDIDLSYNQLSGNIPSQLGNLTSLGEFELENNSLSGALPGSLTNLNLGLFFFNNTNLCEPGDPTFQAWLASIDLLARTGVICTVPPSAEFDAWPQNGNAPLTVAMHIVSTANISNCTWEYGDAQTGNSCANYHDHIYTSAGTYTVKLTVSGPGGSDTMTRNNYIVVSAQTSCYTLTTSVSPANGGAVVTTPSPNCQGSKYTQGTVVSLLATANVGYIFSQWGGSASGNANPVTVTMDGNKNITASFNPSISTNTSTPPSTSTPTFTPTPTPTPTPLPNATSISVTAIAAGAANTCAVMSDGGVKCWGDNVSGELGDGTFNQRLTPVDVVELHSRVTTITTRGNHTCALTSNGGAKCWGDNFYGPLGNGSRDNSYIPVDVVGLNSGVIAITAGNGYGFTCAVMSNGGAKCWGDNEYGNLGNGSHGGFYTSPVDVVGLNSGVIAITAGTQFTCALTSGGGVKCWGSNYSGELGIGSRGGLYTTPVDVIGLNSGVITIAAGGYDTCAVMSDGGVKCWGISYGVTPVNIVGLGSGVTAVAVSSGLGFTCAVMNNGGAKCWGRNDAGQLGDGTTTNRPTPVDVVGLSSGVTSIAAGDYHTCAVMSNGGAKCWGANGEGKLGDGTTTDRLTPVDVVGLGGATPLPTSTPTATSTPISTPCSDMDRDALCDNWELQGYNGVDLPAMGADPNHKDIFVEIDYMVEPGYCLFGQCILGHSHKPKFEAIEKIVETFKNAPISNPDNLHGINLHVDFDPESTMRFELGEPIIWGNLSRSNALPHDDDLSWSEFHAIKSDLTNFDPSRSQIFHYAIFAHFIDGYRCVKGQVEEIRTAELIVALGGWGHLDIGSPCDDPVWRLYAGSVDEQAGTFMHELGHNLGLAHGGGDSVENKPNYLSVMNYLFATRGVIIGGEEGNFDYSRSDKIPPLDETSLNETVGLNGGSSTLDYGTRWFCGGSDQWTKSANDAIDWNCNGNKTDIGISADINNDTLPNPLTGFFDWANLDYSSGGAIGPSAGKGKVFRVINEPPKELTFAEDARLFSPYRVSISGPGELQAVRGTTTIYNFMVTNLGHNPDTYTLTVSSSQDWANLNNLPVSVNLASGESREIQIAISIPPSIEGEPVDESELVIQSQTSPNIFDVAYARTQALAIIYLPLIRK